MKYIQENKKTIIEGDLRCKELSDYLAQLNAPRLVWLSEDGSGIIQKAVFDTKTNQIVGPVLPLNDNGMPKTFSFIAQTVSDIEKFVQMPTSSLVYVILAQPILLNSAPFVLQIYGTGNKFTAQDVLNRWETTKQELKK